MKYSNRFFLIAAAICVLMTGCRNRSGSMNAGTVATTIPTTMQTEATTAPSTAATTAPATTVPTTIPETTKPETTESGATTPTSKDSEKSNKTVPNQNRKTDAANSRSTTKKKTN